MASRRQWNYKCCSFMLLTVMIACRVTTTRMDQSSMIEAEARLCNKSDKFYVVPLIGSPKCCSSCGPGFGMRQLCSSDRDTECQPCSDGLEFSDASSAIRKCQMCTVCEASDVNSRVLQACLPTRNTVCTCREGFFFNREANLCRSCIKCPAGFLSVGTCAGDSNQSCEPCPRDSWSSGGVNSNCHQCSRCFEEEREVAACSASRDRHCCPRNKPDCSYEEFLASRELLMRHISGLPSGNSTGREKTSAVVPIACSVMGLVILILILYVFYKLWRQHCCPRGITTRHHDSANSVSSTLLLKQKQLFQPPPTYCELATSLPMPQTTWTLLQSKLTETELMQLRSLTKNDLGQVHLALQDIGRADLLHLLPEPVLV